jgi:serine/threonine-protein kinase RsbW
MSERAPSSASTASEAIEFDCQDLVVRMEVTLPGEPTAISPVVEQVLGLARQMKCAQGQEFAIETALREALANAIRYGCRHDPSRHIQCAVACDASRGMLIVVRDPGPGFDPATVANPLVGENLFSHHGRGIYLINQLMDEVRFERGGTQIRMVKRGASQA